MAQAHVVPSALPERRPRPEARALQWWELEPPTRMAMAELIGWLDAAWTSSRHREPGGRELPTRPNPHEQLATSLLIAGGRGSGKTTLLLSLAQALTGERAAAYFRQPGEPPLPAGEALHAGAGGALRARAEETLRRLIPRIVLLSPLDMEPLPGDANLLAALLVRVREALGHTSRKGESDRPSAPLLMDEGMDEPWGKIDQLVRDATFMWEDIPVQALEPRQRAEYQLRAAELYSHFPVRFDSAVQSVSRYLLRTRLGSAGGASEDDDGVMLVLPIDNVDRSIQHLHSVLKLTRMVAHRRLWLLLASGQDELQLFLERSLAKELVNAPRATPSAALEDPLHAVARRQAAADVRRVLPEAHRIELHQLTPGEVWRFCPPRSLLDSLEEKETLGQLLGRVRLPGGERQRRFAALFERNGWLEPVGSLPEGGAECDFTEAGQMALTLSARAALDLWQALYTAATHSSRGSGDEEAAIEIAHRCLLLAINESSLPRWASEQLLHRVLHRDNSLATGKKRIILDLTGSPIQRSKRTALTDVVELPGSEDLRRAGLFRSELHLRHLKRTVLEMRDLSDPGRTVALPSGVAGWFMVLHDLLHFAGGERVVNAEMGPLDVAPELVVTRHEAMLEGLLFDLNIWWIPPDWETFVEYDAFVSKWWKSIIGSPEESGAPEDPDVPRPPGASSTWLRQASLPAADMGRRRAVCRFIFAAWVRTICSVANRSQRSLGPPDALRSEGAGSEQEQAEREFAMLERRIKDALRRNPHDAAPAHGAGAGWERAIDAYEEKVVAYVERTWEWSSVCADSRARGIVRWVRYSLPMMLMQRFRLVAFGKKAQDRAARSGLQRVWKSDEALLRCRYAEMMRAVLQRSDAFRREEELLGKALGTGAQEARNLLLRARDAWLRGPAREERTRSRPAARGTPAPSPAARGRVRGKRATGTPRGRGDGARHPPAHH